MIPFGVLLRISAGIGIVQAYSLCLADRIATLIAGSLKASFFSYAVSRLRTGL
jgi:hypothetical protein